MPRRECLAVCLVWLDVVLLCLLCFETLLSCMAGELPFLRLLGRYTSVTISSAQLDRPYVVQVCYQRVAVETFFCNGWLLGRHIFMTISSALTDLLWFRFGWLLGRHASVMLQPTPCGPGLSSMACCRIFLCGGVCGALFRCVALGEMIGTGGSQGRS